MPPSICERMLSGLTATPQSTAHQTCSTFGSPSAPRETSAICATYVSNDLCTATPRARPGCSFRPVPSRQLRDCAQYAGFALVVFQQREPSLHRILAACDQ